MANILFPILYVAEQSRGRPISYGQIYVGEPDLDPELPGNQKQLRIVQEDGTKIVTGQPFELSAGGVPVYNGATVRLDVDGNYSLKILDKYGAQAYYMHNVIEGQPITTDNLGDLVEPIIANDSSQSYTYSSGAAMEADTTVLPVGKRVFWQGYYNASDGGSNWGIVKSGAHTPDGGSIFTLADGKYVEANLKGNKINIQKFGATPDSTLSTLATNNAPLIQNLVDYLAVRGGGNIYTPAPQIDGAVYGIQKPNTTTACVTVTANNFCFSGDGPASVWKTYLDADIPLHFSSEPDISVVSIAGDPVSDLEVYGMHIKGTNNYTNFGLAEGRGILFRNAKDVSVHDNTITSMSMIGICSEQGDGYFRVQNNQIHSCRYTAINYNGRCYQSIISGNVVSKCNAEVNSVAIQATGHCIITGNTVMGQIANTANCGGISWGEGNYDGIGIISGNLIKHTSFGIKAVFHGACNINGNTIINALNQGGITLVSTTTGGFTVANSDNICSTNLIINCAPYGIDCSAEDTVLNGNKIRNFTPITNPSAPTEPDAIVGTTTSQGIRIRGNGCSITGGDISGCTHGLTTTVDQINGIIGGVNFKGNTYDYSLESATPGTIVAFGHAVIEREYASPSSYRERIFRSTRPTQGYFELSSEWTDPTPAIGSPVGQIVLFAKKQTCAAQATSGATTIQLVSTSGWFASPTATVCGLELDNGAWHWTTFDSVSSPNITIGTPIPAGRTVEIGANVYYNNWRALANLL